MNAKVHLLVVLAIFLTSIKSELNAQCTTNHTLSSDININVTDLPSYTSLISNPGATHTVNIDKNVIVPEGKTLTIKGIPGTIFNVRFVATAGITVKPGGLLIMEYCNVDGNGNCPNDPNSSVTTWNGILVEGDPNEEHYDWYDLTNGWDPYADPFVPGGTYKSNSGGTGYAHGRAQIRFSSFSGIYTEGNTGITDDPDVDEDENPIHTAYLKENLYGNYAIRSTEGGILNIIDCDFSDVKTAILIDNYTQYPTGDPESSLMNAFQIVDCQFDVSSSQRGNIHDYRFCIELYEAQKVTVEGCVFNSNGSETWNTSMGTAIYMENSSLLMHKSGNFRRTQDFSTGETSLGCPEYGKEMSWSGKDTNHVWHTDSLLRCQFNNFNRAIEAIGAPSTDPLHTLALDDVEFNNTYFTISCEKMVGVSISRSDFYFDESTASFSVVNETPVKGDYEIDDEDKVDITLNSCKSSLITECDFSSNYDGLSTQTGKNIYIELYKVQSQGFSKNVYDLVYKNTFNPSNHGKDIGVWLARSNTGQAKYAYVLNNCNTFQHLKCAIFIGNNNTKLCSQFHYTDIGGGMDAAALNTFSSNTCDFNANSFYPFHSLAAYYRLNTEIAPNDCLGGNNIIEDSTTTDDPECNSMTCTKFPMKLSVPENTATLTSIYPNPNNGNFTIQFENPIQNAHVFIVDLTGKVVYQKQIDKEVIKLLLSPNLSSGYYNLAITTESESYTKKLVIQ